MADKKITLTAIHRIMKPDLSGFYEPEDQFDADELTDKGAYLIAGGHVISSEGAPAKADEDPKVTELEKQVKGLKIQIGKHEVFGKRVKTHVDSLPQDQKKAFQDAVNKPEPDTEDDKKE